MAEAAPTSIADALEAARRALAETSATPALDARLLAADAFGLDATGLVLKARDPAGAPGAGRLGAMVARRRAGEPVHRILGRRGFYAHDFALSPETLEPRPDTEVLVELAAKALRECRREEPVFADLGTGTGAIAVSLLALFPRARCVAVDISPGALRTARRNATAAGVEARLLAVAGDYLGALGGPLDLVVSNPPYIPTADIATLSAEVRLHDPLLALDGGADGLAAYRAIAEAAGSAAVAPPEVLFEIGVGQAEDVDALMEEAGYERRESARDLAGHVRALRFGRAVSSRSCGKREFPPGSARKRL